jgi:hypothetical protein
MWDRIISDSRVHLFKSEMRLAEFLMKESVEPRLELILSLIIFLASFGKLFNIYVQLENSRHSKNILLLNYTV